MTTSNLRHSIYSLIIISLLAFTHAATWEGSLAGTPAWVTIIPRGHTITEETMASEPWWAWGDTTSDVFIFAFETPDNIRLILDFSTLPDGRSEARLFLDRNEVPLFREEPLSYTFENGAFNVIQYGDGVIARVQHPNYLFQTRSGSWIREDGHPNYDLVILYEGIHPSVDDPPDGVFDRRMEVGSSTPGVPQWQTQRLLVDPRPSSAYNRFAATLRMPNAAPYQQGDFAIPSFPYLGIGIGESRGVVPFAFDPTSYRITHTPFPGFHTAGIYWIHSNALPPYTDFETPFVFSNFEEDDKQDAEMAMRALMNVRIDHLSEDEHRMMTSTTNRQSWKIDDSEHWRFALHFTGFHDYEDMVTIGNESFYSVSGEDFARWTNERAWPHISFVEATEGYPGSEGIYFYAVGSSQLSWLFGEAAESSGFNEAPFLTADQNLNTISSRGLPPHFRGEYVEAADGGASSMFYRSSIDNRIHLYNAMGGVWHLDNGSIIRVHNTDGDPYIDGWTQETVRPSEDELAAAADDGSVDAVRASVNRAEDSAVLLREDGRVYAMRAFSGRVHASLYVAEGYALYWNDNELTLRQTDIPLSDGLLNPPVDRDSWRRFKAESAAYLGQDRDPTNLRQWLDSMLGSTMSLTNVTVSDYRTVDTGFQFLLNVSENTEFNGDLIIPSLQRLTIGEYVIRYSAETDRWDVEPALPEDLVFSLPATTLYELRSNTLNVNITNPGNVDREVSLCLVAENYIVTENHEIGCVENLSILGGQTAEHSFVMTPISAGEMTLRVTDLNHDQDHITTLFQIEAVDRLTVGEALQISGDRSLPITIIASLVFIGAIWGLTRSWQKL